MPIFAGNYGSSKILSLTKSSKDQWNITSDSIFHSQLPYVRVVEHELTNFSWVQEKMWQQQQDTPYWHQTNPYGPDYQPQSIWWCGQSFPLTDQLKNMLQNTNRAFMIFIQWNDGWWEPYNPVTMEHRWLYEWTYQGFTDQDNRSVANWFKNTYGMTKYSTQFFIPRMRVNNGKGMVSPTQYVMKVRILELLGLEVTGDGALQITFQNPTQTAPVLIDNTRFMVGGVDIMQEKYLALMMNTTHAEQLEKTHNVQQDMVYPQNLSYTMETMDLVSLTRTLGGGLPRNSPPVILGSVPNAPTWEALDSLLTALVVKSLTNNWTKEPPQAWCQPGGVIIPRLGLPTNHDTYVHQPQSVRRDDFLNLGMGQAQRAYSKLMQVQVLQGAKFGSGVYLDSTKPQIGRGGRQLFSPQTQGVARIGPTRKVNIPREALITTGLGTVTVYQFHHKVQLYQFSLSPEEQNQSAFIISQYSRFFPFVGGSDQVYRPTCQITTVPPTSNSQFAKLKRSNQDQEVGFQIQNCTINDHFIYQSPTGFGYAGVLRQEEQSRQVHQVSLQSGDKYILSTSEGGINHRHYPNASAGVIHYLERVGNTIYLMSETYLNQTFEDGFSILGGDGLFGGGFGVGIAQVL